MLFDFKAYSKTTVNKIPWRKKKMQAYRLTERKEGAEIDPSYMVNQIKTLQQIYKNQRVKNTNMPLKKKTTKEETRRKEWGRTMKTTRKQVTKWQ